MMIKGEANGDDGGIRMGMMMMMMCGQQQQVDLTLDFFFWAICPPSSLSLYFGSIPFGMNRPSPIQRHTINQPIKVPKNDMN